MATTKKTAEATEVVEHGAHDVREEGARGYRKARRGYVDS